MNDKGKILIGIVIFLIIFSFPFWYSMGKAGKAPEVVLTPKAKEAKVCVSDTQWMSANHPLLLDQWRDTVVRNNQRIYVNEHGKEFTMSLSNTCLDCHSNKTEFCDRCHDYASVSPYCWECHIDNPKEAK